jgi:putative membrane protein insertion efficiency factor
MIKKIDNLFSLILTGIIKFYKFLISPFFHNACHYDPTCSEYFIQCLKEFGFIKGSFKGILRILRCHPIKFLGGGFGYDPVIIKKIKNGK